jgi:Molybdopterin oxidoreductase
VSWEATAKRTTPEFFAAHTVSELWSWQDFDLENEGSLTHPMVYDRTTDRSLTISWEEAMAKIGAALRALPDPDMAEFYTSGRTSNEAAFLYQLFVREYGTNNFPDCSNMCHEATSVGLPESIGVGKGTVTLEDFDDSDCIFCIGHNPGTNHPRMLTTLREASKRGVPIIAINPMRERGLERFTAPQNPVQMLTLGSTPIASSYYLVKVGGDVAVLRGIMKAVLALDAKSLAEGGPGFLDREFISAHTSGIDALLSDIEATTWQAIENASGLSRSDIEDIGSVYAKAKRVITNYGMGITQHRHGTANVRKSPTFSCFAATLDARAPASRRCAAIPTYRVIEPSGSRKFQMTHCWTALPACSVSSRHAGKATAQSKPSRQSRIGARRRWSASAATLRSQCRIRKPPLKRCAALTSPFTLLPSSTARICSSPGNPSYCRALGAPKSICRPPDRNRSRSRIRCRWCMLRAAASSLHRNT